MGVIWLIANDENVLAQRGFDEILIVWLLGILFEIWQVEYALANKR